MPKVAWRGKASFQEKARQSGAAEIRTRSKAFEYASGQTLPRKAVHHLTRAIFQDLRDTVGCSESTLFCCLCDHLCSRELCEMKQWCLPESTKPWKAKTRREAIFSPSHLFWDHCSPCWKDIHRHWGIASACSKQLSCWRRLPFIACNQLSVAVFVVV